METYTTVAQRIGMPAALGRGMATKATEALSRGKTLQAKALAEGLVLLNPKDPVAWLVLSSVHTKVGDRQAAAVCAAAAVGLAPQFADAHLALGQTLALLGRREEARKELQEAGRAASAVGQRARALIKALGA